MNKLTKISLSTGSKISKPYIYTQFFPLPFDKYITFHSDNVGTAKNYDYIQDVINILLPVLNKENIKIVQLGAATDRQFSNCVSLRGNTSVNQTAYIIQNSMLHFGVDGFSTHIAASFDIPLVSLFSNNFVGCDKPYFGSPEKQVLITSYDRTESKKPSFANDEMPKSINLIKPEEIAAAVFKLLKINFEIPFETVFTGKKYSNMMIQESYPNHRRSLFKDDLLVEIRADKGQFNEEDMFYQLAQYKKSILVLDKPINLNVVRQFRPHVQMIAFKITEIDYRPFLSELEALGCKLMLISDLPTETINSLKIKYYDIGMIQPFNNVLDDKINELKKDADNLYYRSCKITASKDKLFSSQAGEESDLPMQNLDSYQKVIDLPVFWKELDFYTIIRKK